MTIKADSEEEDEEVYIAGDYEVEKILDDSIRNGKKEYLIKWKGWCDRANSWEPARQCKCRAKINQYNKIKKQSNNLF